MTRKLDLFFGLYYNLCVITLWFLLLLDFYFIVFLLIKTLFHMVMHVNQIILYYIKSINFSEPGPISDLPAVNQPSAIGQIMQQSLLGK